jgi:hypothetical protein
MYNLPTRGDQKKYVHRLNNETNHEGIFTYIKEKLSYK